MPGRLAAPGRAAGWRLVRARRTAVPTSVRRFAQRARRRRIRAARPWLVLLAGLAGLGLVALVVLQTPLFGVNQVRVVGASMTGPAQVRAAAAIQRGTPLARVDAAAVSRRVGGLPPVRSAEIRRQWPRTLVISVVERVPVAVVDDGTGLRALDETGVAFGALTGRPAGLPLVKLINPVPGDVTTRAAMTVLRSLPAQLRQPLAALVAEAPTRVRLEMVDGRTVIWGDSTENEAKARVAIALLAGAGTVIDVSAPGVVTVR